MRLTHRREFLKAAGILGAAATVGTGFALTTSTDESGGSWPMLHGNAGRTGATADTGPDSSVATDWWFDMDGGMFSAEPVIDENAVYLAVTTAHTPSVSEGYVAAYDPATGDELWKRDGISRPGTPAVADGTVYFDTHGAEDAEATGFFALDSESGETKWHETESAGLGGPLVAGGKLYCKAAGDACRLDPETGEAVWQSEDIGGGACYADGTLFYGEGVALSAEDGTILWDASGDEDELQTVADGLVYSVHNDSDGGAFVRARAVADGAIQWSHPLDIEGYWWEDRLTVAGGRVFFRRNNTIHALDAETGDEVWTSEAGAELTSSLTVGDGTLFVGGRTNPETDTGDAVIVAIDAASGEQEWQYAFGGWEFDDYGPAAGTPVVADGRVYAATFPEGSTLDWMYTEYADFYALGSADEPPTETTETTTETTETTETTDDGTPSETTTSTEKTTTMETTKPETTTTQTTGTTQTTTMETTRPSTTETTVGSETGTTTTDGQPGFGVLTAVGGLAGVGAYLRNRIEGNE